MGFIYAKFIILVTMSLIFKLFAIFSLPLAKFLFYNEQRMMERNFTCVYPFAGCLWHFYVRTDGVNELIMPLCLPCWGRRVGEGFFSALTQIAGREDLGVYFIGVIWSGE